jgi:cellulose biosynthesis protein BcsQ
VLNQFDATLPLHLDVREVLRRQLGERLVRFAIRRSAVVSEALAEGMTVVDYAPSAPVSKDFLDVALWLRSVSSPAAEFSGASWGQP